MATHHGPRGPSPWTRWHLDGAKGFSIRHHKLWPWHHSHWPYTLAWMLGGVGGCFWICFYPILDRRCGCSNLSSIATYKLILHILQIIAIIYEYISSHVTQNGEILYTWHVFFLLEMLEKTMVFAPRSINISETYEHGRWEHACAASAFVSVSCDLSIRRCGKLFLA